MRFGTHAYPLLLLALFFVGCHAFSGLPMALRRAPAALAKPRGTALCMTFDADKVDKFVSKGEKAVDTGKAKRVKPLVQKALKKPSGAVAVGVECSHELPIKADDLKAEFQIFGENGISQKLRNGNAQALWIEKQADGNDLDAVHAFAKEQHKAKGNFPGPVCVIRGGVASLEEAAEAAAAGCSAIALSMADVGGAAEDLVLAAKGMELESVAVVASAEEAQAAVEAGAGVVLAQPASEDDFSAIREAIPDKVAAVVRIDMAKADDGIAKGREFHASGYNAVMIAGLCTTEANSLELPCTVIGEIASKRSSAVQVRTVGVRDAEAVGGAGLAAATAGDAPPAGEPAAKKKKVRPNFKKKKAAGKKTPVGLDTWGLDDFTQEDEEDPDAVFYEKMKTFSGGGD